MLRRFFFGSLASWIEAYVETFEEEKRDAVRAACYAVLIVVIIVFAVLSTKLERDGDKEFQDRRSAAEVDALIREELVQSQAEQNLPIPGPSLSGDTPQGSFAAPTPEVTPAVPSPDDPELKAARLLMASARQKWDQGDRKGSLVQAEKALSQFSSHLGPDHPKVAEVQAMVQAASR